MSFDENYEITIVTADGENWKKEKIAVAGIRRMFSRIPRMLSEWMSSGYKEKMTRLRDVDDSIREWAKMLKSTVRELKIAFRAGRIIDVAILFGQLNRRIKSLVEAGEDVKNLYEEALSEFEGEHELYDFDVLKEFDKKEAAGFLGDLARKYIGSKFYGREIRERNMAVRRLIAKAEHVYKTIESYLDEMHSAKARGDIGRYVDMLKNISDKQKEFETSFIPVYDKYLRKSVDRIMAKQKEETKEPGAAVEKTVPMEAVMPEGGVVGNRAEEVPFVAPPDVSVNAPTIQRDGPAFTPRNVVPIESAPPTPATKPPRLPEPLSEDKAPDTDINPEEEPAPHTLRSGGLTVVEMIKNAIEDLDTKGEVAVQAIMGTDENYMQKSLLQRNPGPHAAGSVFDKPQTKESLAGAKWSQINDPNVGGGAVAFVAPISGKLGVISINDLHDETPCVIQPMHGGAIQGLAECAAVLPGESMHVDFTTLIVGPKDDKSGWEMWTFFPGPSTKKPKDVPLKGDVFKTTIDQAKLMGFEVVKNIKSHELLSKDDEMEKNYTKEAHETFIKGLASFDDPRKMALAILKYAELIEDEDLETSLRLMAIAEGIV
jgi:hypothetical protein